MFIFMLLFAHQIMTAQTWENTNCLGMDVVYDLTASGGKLIVARGGSGIISSSDGTTWTNETVGATGSFRSIKIFGSTLYTASNASNIYTSENNGVSWNLLGGKSGLESVYMTTFFKNNSVMVYSTSSGSASTYYSNDDGSTWSVSQFDYGSGPQSGFEAGQKNIIELDGVLYFSSLKDVFKSTDNGATWSVVSTAPNIPDGTVTSLCATDDALILTIYGYGTHKSTDGGLTWTMILGGSFGTLTNNMTIAYYYNGYLFVGGALGMVYVSEDDGANWTEMNIGGIEIVQCFHYFNGYIYAGTNSNLHRYEYAMSTVNMDEEIPNTFNVFPNPTTGLITIENDTFTTFDIINVNGEVVHTGSTSLRTIDLSAQPQGVYFLRVNNQVVKIVKY